MQLKNVILIMLVTVLTGCGDSTANSKNKTTAHTPAKDTCEDPDAPINCCFRDMPSLSNHVMKISAPDEKGEPMVITGNVYKADGRTPMRNVFIYAYHTDSQGYYSKKGDEKGFQKFHGHLHGWCKTDVNGAYEIHSIRPAQYPSHTMPAHIHAAFKEPGSKPPYYINDFVFKDDELVTEKYIRSLNSPGGTGIVDIKKVDGVWQGQRDIIIE